MLIEESYEKRAQQPFSARFSTGDPSTGDLSFWQFMTQEDWAGGAGQLDFSTVNKFQKAYGWNTTSGKPALAGGNAVVTGLGTLTALPDAETSGGAIPHIAQMLVFGREAANRPEIILIGAKSDRTYAGTLEVLRAPSATEVGLTRVQAGAGAKWQQQSASGVSAHGFLAVGAKPASDELVRIYGTDYVVVLDQNVPGTNDLEPRCTIPLSTEQMLCIGPTTLGTIDCMAINRLSKVANTWGSPNFTSANSYVSDVPSIPSPYWAKDSLGSIYIVAPCEQVALSAEQICSYVIISTATDVVATGGALVSSIVPYPGFFLTGAVAIAGTVYFIGAKIVKGGSSPTWAACVLKYPETVIWQSSHRSTTLGDVLPRCMYQSSRNEAYFIDRKLDSGEYQSIMRLGLNDVVAPVTSIREDVTGTRMLPAALCRYANSFYIYDVNGNTIVKADINPASARTNTASTARLTSSRFGGNTPLIQKTLYSVTVELSEAVSGSETLTVKANGTTVGTMVAASGTRKEIILTSEVTGSYFEITFEMAGTSVSAFEIYRLTLRYVPTQFKKRAWGFGIRATKRLKLGDGSHESRTPATMFADIEAAWASNTPITYIDVDGVSYQVLVTDFKQKRPLLQMDRLSEQEAFYFVELLEV